MYQSSFLRTYSRFHSALAILEPQIYVVVELFGEENISLLSQPFVVFCHFFFAFRTERCRFFLELYASK